MHPCPDSTFRIDWQVPSDYDIDAEVADGSLDRRIRHVIGDRPYEIVWKSVYRFQSRCADRLRVGRVLLAGDAAHLFSPFGARGLNSGVADAENAAWKIAFVARGWAGEGLLESYHAERHAAARENLEITTATMDFLVPQSPVAAAHRQAVLDRAAEDPAARGMVDSGRLAEPFWYADSPLTTPIADAARSPAAPRAATCRRPARACWCRTRRWPAGGGSASWPATGSPCCWPRARTRWPPARPRTAARCRSRWWTWPPSTSRGRWPPRCPRGRGRCWLLRPDAHVAAVLDRPTAAAVSAALIRALGG